MNNLSQVFTNLQLRNQHLPQTLKNLKSELENCFKERTLEAGVINPGYYSYFLPILERYKTAKLIFKYYITEEQYTDSQTGNLIKVPCVDVITESHQNSNIRLFILLTN
jgi:hypothetical protein